LEGTAIALLDVESWKFLAPFYLGDTIHVRIKVAQAKASKSKPDRGVVKLYFEVVNQDGTVIQTGYKTFMIKTKRNT
jgi:acyl dehydratase